MPENCTKAYVTIYSRKDIECNYFGKCKWSVVLFLGRMIQHYVAWVNLPMKVVRLNLQGVRLPEYVEKINNVTQYRSAYRSEWKRDRKRMRAWETDPLSCFDCLPRTSTNECGMIDSSLETGKKRTVLVLVLWTQNESSYPARVHRISARRPSR